MIPTLVAVVKTCRTFEKELPDNFDEKTNLLCLSGGGGGKSLEAGRFTIENPITLLLNLFCAFGNENTQVLDFQPSKMKYFIFANELQS